MNKLPKYLYLLLLMFLYGCSAYLNQPTHTQKARFGEENEKFQYLNFITPETPIVVGVYKFKDQTGQYKQVENGVSYSTAVTQGATTILVKALEDSKWFIPIERENISNLLNERQIIRSTRQEENQKNGNNSNQDLPPLLFAGILLEGGIISYDSNIITGGSGIKYFGIGGSNQYREDRITIYLRAVSTSSGKILKTVYISKTILSQAVDINLYKYVKLKRILEVETGVSQNEPTQMAIKDAIDKAVESLIVEGVQDGLWKVKDYNKDLVDTILKRYQKEKKDSEETELFDRKPDYTRGKNNVSFLGFGTYVDGDYSNSEINYGAEVTFKLLPDKSKWNITQSIGFMTLENTKVFVQEYMLLSSNLEYNVLPYDKISPFVYGGGGGIMDANFDKYYLKIQYGGGLEILSFKNVGLKIFAEQNYLFTDQLDFMKRGNKNDSYWKFGIGINLFLNN